jgi:hypothetical protein
MLGAAARDDTAQLVEQREELAIALRDIATLPPRERRALEMDQAGMGAHAIAAELDSTPNAVHQALFRARRRLRGARAVVWGLIPVGLIPLVLRASDPALAVAACNLPPGMPAGRALPVAGLVAVAMVGGSVVAPDVDPRRGDVPAAEAIANTAAARNAAKEDDAGDAAPAARTVSSNRGPSVNSGPSPNSGKGKAGGDGKGKAGDDETDDAGKKRNRGSRGNDDDDGGSSDRNRHRGKVSGTPGGAADDDHDEQSTSGSGSTKGSSGPGSRSRSGKGSTKKGGSGSSTPKAPRAPKPPSSDDTHAPDRPDDPDKSGAPDDG